jgi:uncharacterized protein
MSSANVVPALVRALGQLRHVLGKGDAHAQAQGWDPGVLLAMRLAPDMLPLTRQVQIATDISKSSGARLTGGEAPKFDDTETSFAELDARIGRAIAYLESLPDAAFDGAEVREILVPTRARGDLRFTGRSYIDQYVLPNVYFHCTTAYALLRHAGVPVGKVDYLGQIGTGG